MAWMASDGPIGQDEGRLISHVPWVGSTEFGAIVQFALAFSDGTREAFRCNFENMHRVMNSLRSAASVAEQSRAGNPQANFEAASPYQVTRTRLGQAADGSIGMQFLTADGIPILVMMPRNDVPAIGRTHAGGVAEGATETG